MTASYTLFIGTQTWSSWSLRPYVALMATGQAFELVKLRLRLPETRAEILKISPSGKLPALRLGDGEVIWDSLAICEFLAERHPEAGLLPQDAKARALARSYAAEMHAGFADIRDQLGMEFARTLPMPALREDTKIQLERISAAWQSALTRFGGDFLFGRLSIADCMYAPVVSRFRTYGVVLPADVQAYADRIWALPAMQNWLKGSEAEIAEGLGFY